jgi:pimeloyl-ACP methyl ester carboxylesterase
VIIFYGELASGKTASSKSQKSPVGNQKNKTAENTKDEIAKPGFKQGEFTLQTNIPGNNEVKVSYIVPVDDKGKPRLSAHNIVFYAPYISERGFFTRDFHKYFPEELGFTIFSLNINANIEDAGDRKKYYCFKESGWHDIVFKAQAKITSDLRLTPRKLLVIGESAGGSMAQQLGINYPDKIDAVAMVGGRFFEPLKTKSGVAWLSINTWGCPGLSAAKLFKEQADKIGVQVLRGETPPRWVQKDKAHYHHSPNELAFNLMQVFIRDIAKLRQKYVKVFPPVEKWPASEIICGEKQYFPSAEFATLWNQLPHEASKFLADEDRDKNKPIILDPPLTQPSSVVLFIQDPSFDCSTMLLDNLYYFTDKGAIAVSVEMSDDYFETLKRIKNTLDFVLKNEKWSTLPVYVAGSGSGGQLAAVAALSNGDKRIKRITTFNSEYEWPFRELSIAGFRNRADIPLKMIFGVREIPAPVNARATELVFIEGGGMFFGDKWFPLLDDAVK